MINNLKKYLNDQWLPLIKNKKTRPNKTAVKETVVYYAIQDEKERATDEVINTPSEELKDHYTEVENFINNYIDENW